ncbi:unnamed protein product [Miscanthus lutarioriparius]|uniref:DNA polymerase epsilon catalytic subunit n=1 Tax=Miscanthus lutarioriparius TaxID=422564 RepID=A0A811QYP0_9POAL|nr:unnamed protein product [Miscanthus lutarioriparius]
MVDYLWKKLEGHWNWIQTAFDIERPSKSSVEAEVFDKFLHGSTLEECYSAVASVANRWLDLLDNQGIDIANSELLDFISELITMSKSLVDYGEQKSCVVTTAKRLAKFLGDSMVKDNGLHCQYIVAREPQEGTPVSERAVPVAIFETHPEIAKHYLRKWCRISSDASIRSIVDLSYYKQRLSSAIQKIITIPAAMQKISNLVPDYKLILYSIPSRCCTNPDARKNRCSLRASC